MEVKYGEGETKYGTGVDIALTGEEVCSAIFAYLTAHGCYVNGATTVRVNNSLVQSASLYVDPSGQVIFNGKRYSGRGEEDRHNPTDRFLVIDGNGKCRGFNTCEASAKDMVAQLNINEPSMGFNVVPFKQGYEGLKYKTQSMVTHIATCVTNDPSFPDGLYERIFLETPQSTPDEAVRQYWKENDTNHLEGFVLGVIYDNNVEGSCQDEGLTEHCLYDPSKQ